MNGYCPGPGAFCGLDDYPGQFRRGGKDKGTAQGNPPYKRRQSNPEETIERYFSGMRLFLIVLQKYN